LPTLTRMGKIANYWLAYQECPECGKNQKANQAYFQCKNCDYEEKEHIKESKRKNRVEPIIREIVEYLLKNDSDFTEPFPTLDFASESLINYDYRGRIVSGGGLYCEPGWYLPPPQNVINIPQKTYYLPNREIVEVASHETAHAPTWRDGHGEKFHHKYMDYRRKAFNKFSSFVNEPYEAKYTINFNKEFYKKTVGFDLEDLKYNPYEDD